MFTIRQELSSDYNEVGRLVEAAFAVASHSDGTEAAYQVRTKDTFVPDLSFVAESDGKIVGQIVLYETLIITQSHQIKVLVLSPISIHPAYFRRGIARSMIEHALERAAELGYLAVFLCGEPKIYHNLGFSPSYEFGIYHKNNPTAEWCMGCELFPDALANIHGMIDIV